MNLLNATEWALLGAGGLAGSALFHRLPSLPDAGRATGEVSVVVPARDEERLLPRLLESLRRQTLAPIEILVVDDGSSDGTRAAAARLDAVTVLDAGERPAGWVGKTWPCAVGAARARGHLLLFLDADVELAPEAIARLVAAHAAAGGLVSVQPRHLPESLAERLAAVLNVVAVMGTGVAALRPLPAAPTAFGPCMLTSGDDYRAVGGHAVVRGAVVEDLGLARAYEARSLPVRAFAGGDAVSYRMHATGYRGLVESWSKNLALGAATIGPLRSLGVATWITAALVAAALPLRAVWGGLAWPVAAAVYAVFALQLHAMTRRVGRFGALMALAFPLPLVVFVTVFARSAYLTLVRREVEWRGRLLPVTSPAPTEPLE